MLAVSFRHDGRATVHSHDRFKTLGPRYHLHMYNLFMSVCVCVVGGGGFCEFENTLNISSTYSHASSLSGVNNFYQPSFGFS